VVWQLEEGFAVEQQEVEEIRREGDLLLERGYLFYSTEAAHSRLEGVGLATPSER
jgi:hypothetical protein